MAHLKLKAAGLFTGKELFGSSHVLIAGEDGTIEDIVPEQEAGDNIQTLEGWLSPGFVNCHCHLELSHMKGMIPEHTGLVDFVMTIMQQRHFAEAEILAAIELAENDMWQNGIVAVGDICNTAHSLQQKSKGRLHYHNFIEVSGFVPAAAPVRFNQALEVYRQFADQTVNGSNSGAASLVPHAPYSVSPALFQLINTHSAGKIVTIHNQETPEEDLFYLNGQSRFRDLFARIGVNLDFYQPPGISSLQACLPLLDNAATVLLVHNTCSGEADIAFSTRHATAPVYWCLCANANSYIENRLPPVELLRRHGRTIVLGTDSLASNHQLSILAEIQTLAKYFPAIPLTELLQWASFNGAHALHMQHRLGSFEKGKQPGIVHISGISDGKLLPGASARRIV